MPSSPPPAPAAATGVDPRQRHGYHRLRVKRVVPETGDTRSFVLDVPAELREAFRYRAGQFCTFRVRIGQDEHLRCYSMSSAPETDDDLTVTVKRVPGGLVSNWFNDHVSEGSVVEVTRPAGVFCLRESEGPVVALCGGSGVTPVMSIVKSVLATTGRRVELLYANRDRGSVIFAEQLRSLQVAHPDRLTLHHHIDADGGYLDATTIAGFAAGSLDGDFYICGPTPFMDLVEATLHDLGVDPGRILLERFVTPGDPVPEPTAPEDGGEGAGRDEEGEDGGEGASRDEEGEDGGEGAGRDEEEVTETVTLILNRKETSVAYRPGDTVLGTARRGGLAPPFSCEAGNCATCMAKLREGSATMRVNDALTPEEVADGWILTCQALPQTPTVTVDYDA